MTYKDFHAKHEAAIATIRELEGANDFPGLSVHDRVYDLGENVNGWPTSAIVRAHTLYHRVGNVVPVDLWVWTIPYGSDGKLDELTAEQLTRLADIKRAAARWVRGEINELPPSTDTHWRIP